MACPALTRPLSLKSPCSPLTWMALSTAQAQLSAEEKNGLELQVR